MTDQYPSISPATPPREILSGGPENQMEILAKRLAQDDADAFWELFDVLGPKLVNLFKRKGLTQDDAEMLALECLKHVKRQIDKYTPQEVGKFESWVFKLAIRKWLDWRRRNVMTIYMDDQMLGTLKGAGNRILASEDAPQEKQVSPEEHYREIYDALEQLSETDREAIKLRYFEPCYDNAELAAKLGIQINAAKVRLCRAHKHLMTILERDPRIKNKKVGE